MQRQLGHKFYEPIWEMMHKIRIMMGKRDNDYVLEETVEIDEGFFEQATCLKTNELTGEKEEQKRGRGSQGQAKVLVMTSCEPVDKYKEHEKPSKLKFVKMMVLEDFTSKDHRKKGERKYCTICYCQNRRF